VLSVVLAEGERPVPSRTRKLSPPAPMVLHSPGCGRVGRRRHSTLEKPPGKPAGLFLFRECLCSPAVGAIFLACTRAAYAGHMSIADGSGDNRPRGTHRGDKRGAGQGAGGGRNR